MSNIITEYPVKTLDGIELLPAGTELTGETLEELIKRSASESFEPLPLMDYGSVRQDLSIFINYPPYNIVFSDQEQTVDILKILENIKLPLPVLKSLDYLKQNDFQTYRHNLMVFMISLLLAKVLLPGYEELFSSAIIGSSHDIGKTCVPLKILRKRADGYHDIQTILQKVSLYDTLSLKLTAHQGITVTADDPSIPTDSRNLAYQAADLLLKQQKITPGIAIHINKIIPAGAGLGGGSSNAASVLTGLNRHYEYPFSRERLMSMGFSLGADVPFLLFQQPALVTGIGEKLEAYPDPLPYHVILVYPGFRVSTAEVFQNLNLRLTKCKKKFTKASLKKTGYNISLHACNDLEAVTAARYPVIKSVKEQLLKQGASGVLMSGSGPTVFGLFTDQNKADKAMQAIGRHSRWNVYPVEIINENNYLGY